MTRRALLKAALGVAASGLAVACTPLPALTPPAATPRPTARPRQETLTPRPGGSLLVTIPADPDTLDPANALTAPSEAVGRPMFDTLVQLGPAADLRPALAERWEVSKDGLRYTFFLRKDASFHDGTPFDAAAAQYSLERLLGDERPRARSLVAGIVRAARALDSQRLEVALERPFSTALHLFAQHGLAMVSPVAHRNWGSEFGRSPVGSGPFRFAGRSPNGELRLERWDEGWRGKPLLDRVIFRRVPDEATRLTLLENGEAQLAGPLSLDGMSRLTGNAAVAAESFPTARAIGVAINTQVVPFTDKRVRQALNYAIDKAALVRTIYSGRATPLGGPLAPTVRGAAPLLPYPFDPDRARKLLTDAGFPSLLDFPLVAPRGRFPGDDALAQEVQRQLQAVGVRARLELLDPTQYTATITKAADETPLRLSMIDWLPRTLDPRAALYPLFHSTEWMPRGQNTSFFKNPILDEWLDRATRAADPDDADRLFRRAQELVRDEAPWIFLLSPNAAVARSSDLHDPLLLPTELVTVSERTWVEG